MTATRPAHSAGSLPGARFIDPRVLSRIANLELLARTVVVGFVSGLHRSPHLGLSTDFAQHRPYLPGDDLRRLDWRLWGRTDRLYLKEFEAETNASVTVLLDCSRSMSYTSGGLSKLDYGRYLAACLLWFSRGQRDRVGLVTFDSEVLAWVPPSAGHLLHSLHALERATAGRPGELGPPLSAAAGLLNRRGIVVVVSDLYEEPESVAAAVRQLRRRGSDVIVMHLLDPAEITFPFEDAASFEDLESEERIPVVPTQFAEEYRGLVESHIGSLRRLLGRDGVDYALLDTSKPLDHALFTYLASRQRLARVR